MKKDSSKDVPLELEKLAPGPTPLPVGQRPSLELVDINALFNKALDAKSAVEVLKELRLMKSEDEARWARQEFYAAMTEFQAECPVIVKEKIVPDDDGKVSHKFAPLEAVEVQIKPYRQKHGFSHRFDQDITGGELNCIICKCIVKHKHGHEETSTVRFPLVGKTRRMNDSQVSAATMTFAQRYALRMAYGLVFAGEDIDGQTGKLTNNPSSLRAPNAELEPLRKELWNLLAPVRGKELNWVAANQWLWKQEILDGGVPETAPKLSAKRFREVIDKSRKALTDLKLI